jgi:hypothetical protein
LVLPNEDSSEEGYFASGLFDGTHAISQIIAFVDDLK